jgi:glutamate racemase
VSKRNLIREKPIGIFDSGVGGLTVLQAIQNELPHENLIYFADQAHVPYGNRPMTEVQEFSLEITNYLIQQGVKLVVVACNAASAAALKILRNTFTEIPIIGMEPAVKPAAVITNSGVVGVLATPATFQGELYKSLIERFAKDVRIEQHTCPGLVSRIEVGDLTSDKTRGILEEAIQPMLEKGIDTIVLGCTHYPFVIPLIQEISGPGIRVIDPAPAVARQVHRILITTELLNEDLNQQNIRFITTGEKDSFQNIILKLIGINGIVEDKNN